MSVRVRYAVAVAAGALLLGGIAVANAANDRPQQEAGRTSTLPDGTTRNFVAGAAGSVEIARTGDSLSLVRTTPNAGFAVEIESGEGREIEVQFSNGASEVDFNAELEDGEIRVRVRDDDGDDIPSTSTATAPDDTVPDTTTPTVPDDDDDDGIDNSGPGNFEDNDDGDVDNSGPGNADHDNSGPGHGDDDDDDDDDNSGPGGGDD